MNTFIVIVEESGRKQRNPVGELMRSGKGLEIEKNFAKFDVKVLAAETRKQAMLKDLGIGPKTNFVVYIIRVCRIRDGASCVAAQRYSALRNFYNNLKNSDQVRAEDAPEFPGKRVVTEESFKGDRADVNSEFVRQRKEQLGSFLRQLFNKNPGLWDNPEVQEFFNLAGLEQGKSYAERAHTMAGHGLRHYDPSNPSQWNPYSIAMQAAEENRTRNADFMGNNSSNNPAQSHEGEGAGGARAGHSNGEADGGPGGRGIGAWFRGLGGGAGQGSGGAGAAENGGVGGGNAAPTGRGGRWWGMGGGGDRINEDGMKFSSPVQKQVKVLVEMGFEEDSARQCLKASGYDTNLAAEYCVTGIPPGRVDSALPPPPSSTRTAADRRRRAKTVIGNNVVPIGANTSSSASRRWTYDPYGASAGGGRSAIPGSNGLGALNNGAEGTGWTNPGSGAGNHSEATREPSGALDWRYMPRTTTGGGRNATGAFSETSRDSGRGGGTVDV